MTQRASSLFKRDRRTYSEYSRSRNGEELRLICKQFFGQLTNKVLQFYASRECANHVGQGQRFANLAAKAVRPGDEHALSSGVRYRAEVRGDWQSKQNWKNKDTGGITRKHAEGFAHQAMKKMVAELKEGNK